MRILEARDGFIKFESNEKLALSSFVEIEDIMKKYIAQIVKITNLEGVNVGYAKILYLFDGSLYEYDKTLPESGATIKPFSYENLKEIIRITTPVRAGYFIDNEERIEIDAESFNKKMLISIDTHEDCDKLVSNFKQEFSAQGNVLVIDMLGLITGRKFTASVDFKLPLNTSALEFMYEECLKDATSDSKDLVKEIFADLAEYSKTVPFLPFAALKSIVDDMVNKSHIFKLLVLKNKLAKFDREGYFAATLDEANNLNRILDKKEAVIDLSKLDSAFQNRYLKTIYSAISKLENKPQVFVIASNSIDKKNLKTVMMSPEISSTFVTHSRFKFINEIKTMFSNFIIGPSFNSNEVFKTYKTFLEAMPKDTYLIIGECTSYIPLISINKEFITESIEEVSIDENNRIDYSQLEEALKDPETEAIDKKSEDLIEKISENLESTDGNELNIFDDESDEESEEEFSTKVHPSIELNESEENGEAVEDFQTVVTQQDNEIIENDSIEQDENIEDENESSKENLVDVIENSIEEEIEVASNEVVVEPASEEIIEVEIPDDISDMAEEVNVEIEEATELEDNQVEEIQEYEKIEDSEAVLDEDNLIKAEAVELIEEATLDEYSSIEQYDIVGEAEEENSVQISLEDEPEEILIEDKIITEVIPISKEDEFEEIVELNPEEITEDDIIIDFVEDVSEAESDTIEALDKEIIEDVDKVFTTMKEDTISDSDLDFIDELNEETNNDASEELVLESEFEEVPVLDDDEVLEEGFVESLEEFNEESSLRDEKDVLETKSNNTPIVPVYDAEIPQEDQVLSDNFEQGDLVIHAKYGNGVVEKMIKYGSKTLYSINFDNVGRRLLDPTLTEIKKVN